MTLFRKMKDGGPESRVWGYFLIEWKRVFSVVLLRFEDGSRDAFHSHAFNAVSWVLRGRLAEHRRTRLGTILSWFTPSVWPVVTTRANTHKVVSHGRTWVLSFRGPWAKTWCEVVNGEVVTLTNGRKAVA